MESVLIENVRLIIGELVMIVLSKIFMIKMNNQMIKKIMMLINLMN